MYTIVFVWVLRWVRGVEGVGGRTGMYNAGPWERVPHV